MAENFLEGGEPVRPVKCSVVFNFSLCALATAHGTLRDVIRMSYMTSWGDDVHTEAGRRWFIHWCLHGLHWCKQVYEKTLHCVCFRRQFTMSELEPASTSAPTNSTSTETTQNASEIPVKSENQQHLYMDFSSDIPPVLPTDSQLGGEGIKPDSQVVRKVDPRQQWINKDSTKPYYCKLCDFNMESMEVGAFWRSFILAC